MSTKLGLFPTSIELSVNALDDSMFPNYRLRVAGDGYVTITQGGSSAHATLADWGLIEKRAINDQNDAEYFLTEHAWQLFADVLDPLRAWANKLPVPYDPEAVTA